MLVVLDANVIVKNPLLRGGKWDSASTAVNEGRLRLVVPESVRLEAVGVFERGHQQRIRDLNQLLKRSSADARAAAAALRSIYENEASTYATRLSSRLHSLGATVVDPPEVDTSPS